MVNLLASGLMQARAVLGQEEAGSFWWQKEAMIFQPTLSFYNHHEMKNMLMRNLE